MRQWITLLEQLDPRFREEHGMIVASYSGKDVAWYSIDRSGDKVSVHANVDADYRRKGLSLLAYDWMENHFRERGLDLIPSDRLSKGAYQLWKKRDSDSVVGYTSYDGITWYSPKGIARWGGKQ